MKKCLRNFGTLALSFALIALACSDNTTDANLSEGDPNDPGFQAAQNLTEGFVDSLFNASETAFDFLDFDGSAPMNAAGDTLYVVFHDSTCWWEIYFSVDSVNNSMTFIDSLQFGSADSCQQFPDSLTTTDIEYRMYFDMAVSSDSATIDASGYHLFSLEGIQEDTVVINATNQTSMNMVMGLIDVLYDYDASMTAVKFLTLDLEDNTDPHPVSGGLSMSLSVGSNSPNSQGSVSWSIVITFNPDGYHARAESGNNFWEWDVTYIT